MADQELDLVQAIRQRPAMYIGSTSMRGVFELFHRVVVHSLARLNAEEFSLQLSDGRKGRITITGIETTVSDNLVCQPEWNRAESRIAPYEFAALNALSNRFDFALFRSDDSCSSSLSFENGLLNEGTLTDKDFSASSMEIAFELDDKILQIPGQLGSYSFIDRFKTLALLFRSKTLSLKYSVNGRACETVFCFDKGLQDLIELKRIDLKYGDTFFDTYIDKDFESFSAEIAFAFLEHNLDEPFSISFVNDERTAYNGVHREAVVAGIEESLNRFVQNNSLTDLVITRRAIIRLLLGAFRVRLERPQFEGATRGKLLNPEIQEPLAKLVADELYRKMDRDPETAMDVLKRINRVEQFEEF